MQIEKNGRIYLVSEMAKQWNLKMGSSKTDIVFNVSKDLCKDFEELKQYVFNKDMF